MEEPIFLEADKKELRSGRSDQSTIDAMTELRALTSVMEALHTISNDDARERILRAAASFFRVSPSAAFSGNHRDELSAHRTDNPTPTAFSSERSISPKDFMRDKQPRTDVERVTCLAYFLTHYRDTPHFKTIDLSKLNTEAAQPKLSNAAMAVDNATKSHYLAPAAKGNKQISSSGELFVQALPDRDLARSEMTKFKPKKRRQTRSGRVAEQVTEG